MRTETELVERPVRCPHCYGVAYRVRRTMFDRMFSALAPRRRYRCVDVECGWEGAVPASAWTLSARS